MPRNELIQEFYDTVKDSYPKLSFNKINEACLFPYRYFKKRMSDDDIPDIRVKYLGSWQVYSKPILSEINRRTKIIDKRKEEDEEIMPYEYKELNKLKQYVEDNPKVFSKVDKRRNT